jgi:hypothetical protein
MREFLKIITVVVFMAAAPTAAVAWIDDRPSLTVTCLKYTCPVLSVLAIAAFLKLHFRADEVPDYLRQQFRTRFERGGFCFAFRPSVADGVGHLDIYFQNQQDQRCIGRIALRPARGFFLGRVAMQPIAVEIACEPAAYGVAKVPFPIPVALQGKRQSFEVGASVDYPGGKGRTLRFRNGIVLRADSNFGDTFGTALMVAGALTGRIVYQAPRTTALELPTGVAEELPPHLKPDIKTLWKLGDPPLPAHG